MKLLFAPNGSRIVGTAEELLATSPINVIGRNADGSIEYDHDSDEESTVYWSCSETRTDKNGETLFTDELGIDWPESKLDLREIAEDAE